MDNNKLTYLKETAKEIRILALSGIHAARSGHPGGSLSVTDILTYLYFSEMNVDPADPKAEGRDRFVLSKGHAAPALYATLAKKGFFDESEIQKLRSYDSFLQGHPDMKHTPGIDMSTGSLGLGISAACGIALAGKAENKDYRVYTVIGDGESQEGQVWEACMLAAHYKLDNLCLIVDKNGLQIDGRTEDVLNPAPHDKKLEAFGFNVITVNGHDFSELEKAFEAARECKGKPTAIVASTVKGKGVSFMEDQVGWHGNPPSDEQYEAAVKELNESM